MPQPRGSAAKAPLSTYRIQLRPGFGFDQVAALAPYLAALGVSHLYASPSLQAAPGSTHGYDVVDPTRPNAELGGADGYRRMCLALGAAGLGQVLDIVPNHMAISGPENRWWWDVLENGPSSVFAAYFDVDWDPPEAKLYHTVLLPILGDHYGKVLDAGELSVVRDGGSFCVRYGDRLVPVAPPTLDTLMAPASAAVRSADPEGSVADQLEALSAGLGNLPPSWATDRDSVRERHRDKEVLRASLAQLLAERPVAARAIDEQVARLNADLDRLDTLLERQNYRLAFWRVAHQELDYRRFFDIDTLIGVRVEDPLVFADSHGLVLSWLGEGVIDGLRIDHVDGLHDPAGYLERLATESRHAWVVVEKILGPNESLRETWPVAGTTGYDWLARIGGLFVDPAGEAPLTAAWNKLSGSEEGFEEVAHRAKHAVMDESLAADLARLTGLFVTVCGQRRAYRDFTRSELSTALEEVIASMSVYRTYVGSEGPAHPDDMARINAAVSEAMRRRPELDADLLDALRKVLLAEPPMTGPAERELRMRFEQFSSPVMAKGVEDTALYAYCRFVARNEVGAHPAQWATPVGDFHASASGAAVDWPGSLVASSTHDTKRSEDVRARLYLLSEMPDRWVDAVSRWMAMNAPRRDGAFPDAASEYLMYQTLVGAWPIGAERVVAYMAKATKEAKVHTSWTDPDLAYDAALEAFVRGVLADEAFAADLGAFVETELVEAGWVNSLAQTLVKLTVPGVPDTYQGCECWDYSLVDPDNRRDVDFGLRSELLARVGSLAPEEAWAQAGSGLPKLALTHRALVLRREHPEWFGAGAGYVSLPVSGPAAEHVVAFARAGSVACVVPRLVHTLVGGVGTGVPQALSTALRGTEVKLGEGRWVDVLSGDPIGGGGTAAGEPPPAPIGGGGTAARTVGGRFDVGELLARFPVALLARV